MGDWRSMVSPQPGAPNRRSMAALSTGLLPRSDPRHEASDGDVRASFGRAAEQNPGRRTAAWMVYLRTVPLTGTF